MREYALVLNAGSSSLKFCVYKRAEQSDWNLETRGQVEGIGNSPRIMAKDKEANVLIDRPLKGEVRDRREALSASAPDGLIASRCWISVV